MSLTHMEVGQMLDNRPLWFHRHVVLVCQQPRHVPAGHFLVYQQAFGGPVHRERFYKKFLYVSFAHAL